jgi:hypothetical protein
MTARIRVVLILLTAFVLILGVRVHAQNQVVLLNVS